MKLTFESSSSDNVHQAIGYLKEKLPENSIVSYDDDPINHAVSRLESMLESPQLKQLPHSVQVIEQAAQKYRYWTNSLMFSHVDHDG